MKVEIHRRALAMTAVAAIVAGCTGAGTKAGATPSSTSLPSLETAGTVVVAALPSGQWPRWSWSPDGRYLAVATDSGEHEIDIVYDRNARVVASFPLAVGWLDGSHVIAGDGAVYALGETPMAPGEYGYSRMPVYAGGHGTGIVIFSQPACVGDPMVKWYRDGSLSGQIEKMTPFGWSPDGRLALIGHMTCTDEEAQLHGWKGELSLVEGTTGTVKMKISNVRGELAFNPSGDRIAAQSDADVQVADLQTGATSTIKNVLLRGWTSDHTLAVFGSTLQSIDVGNGNAATPLGNGQFGLPSAADVSLVVDSEGSVLGVHHSNSQLIDLRGLRLAIDVDYPPAPDQPASSRLQPAYWSPDGRMLAVPNRTGTALVLISVDPFSPVSAQPASLPPIAYPSN